MSEAVSPRSALASPSTRPAPILEIEHLSTRFWTPHGVVHAVDDVSLHVRAGEAVGIVGESGSGKSMLTRSAIGLAPKSATITGSVRFDGVNLRDLRPTAMRRLLGSQVSVVFQDPATALNPVTKIGRQITESLGMHQRVRGAAARDRAIELLGQVGIPDPARRINSYPHEISGGMRQRVAIAIALACAPKLLFADEPTTALDVTIQRQILDLLTTLQRQHDMALVLITHDLGVVAHRTDRLIVMYGGRVVETGETRTLLRHPRHPYTSALLASIPRMDQPSHQRLPTISGRPVDAISTRGCRFAPRCSMVQPQCFADTPRLTSDVGGRAVACFFPNQPKAGYELTARGQVPAGATIEAVSLSNPTKAVSSNGR